MNEQASSLHGRVDARYRYAMVDAWHPVIMLSYVVAIVIVACAVPSVPLLSVCLLGGAILLLQTARLSGLRTVAAALALGCAIMVLAPLFDTAGTQVIFAYLGRPYTFEALMRGVVTGMLVAAMIVWFACLFRIVSSDGILQVCGRIAPRIGMVTSLVMQLVPRLSRRAGRVRSARIGACLAPSGGDVGAKAHEAGAVFATVAFDSLERSVVCADAMESRGYGTGARTSATFAPFAVDERAFLIASAALLVGFSVASALHAVVGPSTVSGAALTAYGLFALLPALFNAVEDVRWRI